MTPEVTARANIQRSIRKSGRSLEDVARAAGVPAKVLTDGRRRLGVGDLYRVAWALGVDPVDALPAWLRPRHLRLV